VYPGKLTWIFKNNKEKEREREKESKKSPKFISLYISSEPGKSVYDFPGFLWLLFLLWLLISLISLVSLVASCVFLFL